MSIYHFISVRYKLNSLFFYDLHFKISLGIRLDNFVPTKKVTKCIESQKYSFLAKVRKEK